MGNFAFQVGCDISHAKSTGFCEISRTPAADNVDSGGEGLCAACALQVFSPHYTPQHFWECPRHLPHKIQGSPQKFPAAKFKTPNLTWREIPPPPLCFVCQCGNVSSEWAVEKGLGVVTVLTLMGFPTPTSVTRNRNARQFWQLLLCT